MKKLNILLVVPGLVIIAPLAYAQPLHYTLLAESRFMDDCLICGRPTIQVPMRGTFTLVPDEITPISTKYRVENIAWVGGTGNTPQYDIRGSGTYTVSGEVAVTKKMVLDLTVNGNSVVFTNDGLPSLRGFPDYVIDTSLTQTQENLVVFYSMDLLATPLREVWFSSTREITGAGASFGNGELLSTSGRVVKHNRDLIQRLGFMPVIPHIDVDAVEIMPGAEIWFSLKGRHFSETLGTIDDGDLLSPEGRIVRKYYILMGQFFNLTVPPPPDPGLDALHVSDTGKLSFSVRSNFFSPRLNATVGRGDLLSDRGQIVRSNAQLLHNFRPVTPKDYGLDALYIWPSGEIWFSTEEAFIDAERGNIQEGDILSETGYIAFRNQDLARRFAPGVDQDFGADVLFVVTDLSAAASPQITSISRQVRLEWEGLGRVFQLEKAVRVTGPYLPASPIIPETEWIDSLTGNAPATGFYRVRQW